MIECLSHGGEVLTTYQGPAVVSEFTLPALSACGLLFCVGVDVDNHSVDEIFVFQSQTLELQSHFGRSTLSRVLGLAVGSLELFVSDNGNDCVKAFSFSGELLRTISCCATSWYTGPRDIIFVRDRLYVNDTPPYYGTRELHLTNGGRGRRIQVLTPTGGLLQT